MNNEQWVRTARLAAVLVAALAAFIYGFVAGQRNLPPGASVRVIYTWARHQRQLRHTYQALRDLLMPSPAPRGRWSPVRAHPSMAGLTEEQLPAAQDLRGIGYLSGYEPAPAQQGVTLHIPDLAYGGLNLTVSGHAQEAVLMNMEGEVLHSWTHDARATFPELRDLEGVGIEASFSLHTWRRVHLYPNGDLLAIYEGAGLIKLDKDSNLLWALTAGFHHDVFVDTDGKIYVLERQYKMLPEIHATEPVIEDFITILDPNGKVVHRVSLLEAFKKSSYAAYLTTTPDFGDLFHTNSIQVLDGSQAPRSPVFNRGNILVSVRNMNTIAVVDMETETVVWALSGQWRAQHEPVLLADGNMLLLDNQGHNGMSKVMEIDPWTQEIIWAYYGTPQNGFYTATCGSNQRLPNGNTLIVESDSGRAFEVTPGGRVVWEYYNPARAGRHNELIATLFDVVRLDPDFVAGWLDL